MTDDILVTELNQTFTYLSEFHPNISIIFRSTSIGHSNWQTQRLNAPLLSETDADVSEVTNSQTKYNWDSFSRQKSLVKALIDEYHPHIIFLDIYPSTARRADLHTIEDGLHYCLPGLIDNWVRLLDTTMTLVLSKGKNIS